MASSPITSWQIDGEAMETVRDFILGGLQNHYSNKERRGERRKERWEEEMEGGRKKEKEGHWSSILRANLEYLKISIKTAVVFDQR